MARKLYVRNLPEATTTDELQELFAPFGTVIEAEIESDADTGAPTGFGFVLMDDADADAAIAGLDNRPFRGNILTVHEGTTEEFIPEVDVE